MSISEKRLWAAQKREWPTSVRLTVQEVYRWCDSAPNEKTKLYRYVQISMALQEPRVVWYQLDNTDMRGYRFGLGGREYMSLYSGGIDHLTSISFSNNQGEKS